MIRFNHAEGSQAQADKARVLFAEPAIKPGLNNNEMSLQRNAAVVYVRAVAQHGLTSLNPVRP